MKYSKLFGKTRKNSKDMASKNATLLIRGGFIDQVMAGAYTFLPLGERVLKKIENIIREEMDKIGQEMLMTNLSPVENWKQSGRYDTVDILLKAVPANENSADRHNGEYIVNPTNEDVVTPLVRDFITSYKELPVAVYHIQTKFRNEPRAKSGLLRGREFRMKDLYSFHLSLDDFKDYYEKSKEAYWAVFDRLSLSDKTVIAAASGGDFTEEFSHEFQTKCDAGEDLIFQVPSTGECFNKEVAPAKAPEFKQDEEQLSLEEVAGEGVIGVEALAEQMGLAPEQTTKTLFFEDDQGMMIAAVIRGDRDIDEGKLAKVLGISLTKLKLASEELVKKMTGSEVGYAGLLNLSPEARVVVDDSVHNLVNFEMGGNKTGVHYKNVNWGRDVDAPELFYDIKLAKEGDLYPETGEVYETFKACEVGNIFPLMTKFSDAFGFQVTGEDGNLTPVIMGCYGIGSTRVMGVLAEVFGDQNGVIWPEAIAPYKYHIVTIAKSEDDEPYKQSEQLYKKLVQRGDEVLWDERLNVRPGEKFADADLVGCPIRLVVSPKTLDSGSVEIKLRSESESKLVKLEEV
jgi:prolyl-tRNA synthetase